MNLSSVSLKCARCSEACPQEQNNLSRAAYRGAWEGLLLYSFLRGKKGGNFPCMVLLSANAFQGPRGKAVVIYCAPITRSIMVLGYFSHLHTSFAPEGFARDLGS